MFNVSGQLVKYVQPIANTKLVHQLSYVYKDGFHTDERITDVEGNFSFPPLYENKKRFGFLNMFSVGQSIKAGEETIWIGSKTEPEENSEGRGESVYLDCNLENKEMTTTRIDISIYHTTCHWDVESDPEPDYGLSKDY